jgi:hypothetical protein
MRPDSSVEHSRIIIRLCSTDSEKDWKTRSQREVNITLFSPEEFRRKRALKDHFLSSAFLLKGAPNELGQLAELKANVAHGLKDVAEGASATLTALSRAGDGH